MARRLEVEIVGDASSLKRAFGDASSSSSRFGSALGKTAKIAGLAIGGAALGGIAVTLRTGIKEWTESAKVAAQTGAVLKSTGGAAGVTQKSLETLSAQVQNYSGVSDDAVQAGGNLLLTFTKIRNQAGKNNDIFDQGVKVATDMSVALGTDLNSSAIQVGKALNDPIRGVTALQRVGVSFTKAQRDQIKALVESGQTMKAQKLILRELNTEFGGSAKAIGETLPGRLNILRERFSNWAGELVGRAIPAVERLVDFLSANAGPAFAAVGDAVGRAAAVIGPVFADIANVASDLFERVWPTLRAQTEQAFAAIASAVEVLWAAARPVFQAVAGIITEVVIPVFLKLREIIVQAISKVAAVLRENEPQLRQIFERVAAVVTVLGQVVKAVLENVVVPVIRLVFVQVLPTAISVAIKALDFITAAVGKMAEGVRTAVDIVKTVIRTVPEVFGRVRDTVKGIIDSIVGFFKAIPERIVGFAEGAGSAFVRGISAGLSSLAGALARLVKAPINAIISAWNALGIPGFSVPGFKVGPVSFGGFSVPGISLPDIPHLQEGGVLTSPTLVVAGEAGPEAIIPLDFLKRLLDRIVLATWEVRDQVRGGLDTTSSALDALAGQLSRAADKITKDIVGAVQSAAERIASAMGSSVSVRDIGTGGGAGGGGSDPAQAVAAATSQTATVLNDANQALAKQATMLQSLGFRGGGGLQHGGIVRRPTISLIGEAGPEAVVPLTGGFGMGEVHVHFHGGTFIGSDMRNVARLLAPDIRAELQRTSGRNLQRDILTLPR